MGKYSIQFKLSAVTAYLERTQGFRCIAKQFQIDPTLLRRWVAGFQLHGEASPSAIGLLISSVPLSNIGHDCTQIIALG